MVVRAANADTRTFPICGVDGNRGDLDEDFVLADCRNRTLFYLDRLVCLDDNCSVGLRDLEVGHIKGWFGS